MNITLKELKDVTSDNCVTIILNTHRTKPDNQKDPLTLKNLIKEAEQRLLVDRDKKHVQGLIQSLTELEAKIDHSHNLESLILFVNEDIAEYTRLPIPVEDRVVIDQTFATRDLIRGLHLDSGYYVLVLSQQKVRLIETFNDRVVAEIGGSFPIENNQFYSTNKAELSNATRQTNLVAEFFNRVDKEVNKVRKDNPLPVLICTEESNYHEYLKIADEKQSIFDTFLNQNRVDEKAQAIVEEAWKIVKEHNVQRNNARKEELQKAVSNGLFLSDVNDIWKAISEGRVQTLFVEQGLFQPAVIEDGLVTLVSTADKNRKEVIDDIYDEMIELNMNFGGDVVFLPKGELKDFNGFGATTRY
ncbi:MAG TPA: hypothetical protein PKA53_04200 [Sphingobacterium sp.]|mgnify:CR=1 FL=1|nr:hypothetical protein [Sphingobacterium sp.]